MNLCFCFNTYALGKFDGFALVKLANVRFYSVQYVHNLQSYQPIRPHWLGVMCLWPVWHEGIHLRRYHGNWCEGHCHWNELISMKSGCWFPMCRNMMPARIFVWQKTRPDLSKQLRQSQSFVRFFSIFTHCDSYTKKLAFPFLLKGTLSEAN